MNFKLLLVLCITCLLALTGARADTFEPNCNEPIETGTCKASKPKFAFNKETSKCESFVYGGCQGTGNRFDTLEACQQLCERHSQDLGIGRP